MRDGSSNPVKSVATLPDADPDDDDDSAVVSAFEFSVFETFEIEALFTGLFCCESLALSNLKVLKADSKVSESARLR